MKKLNLFLIVSILVLFTSKTDGQVLNCDCWQVSLKKVTAESGLVLRKSPSIDSDKILTVPYSEKVIVGYDYTINESSVIENIKGDWVRANYKGIEGFLFDGFLNETPEYDLPYQIELDVLPLLNEAPFVGLFADSKDPFSMNEMTLRRLEFETVVYEGENYLNEYAKLKISDGQYPDFIFSGLDVQDRKIAVKFFEMQEGKLSPGVVRTEYYSGSDYSIYATGNVVEVENEHSEAGPTMVIKNYKLFFERRNEYSVKRQVLMEREELPIDVWGSRGLANIRLIGDLDGDAQPDLLIEKYYEYGFETILYLSAEADEGYLLKMVYKSVEAGC